MQNSNFSLSHVSPGSSSGTADTTDNLPLASATYSSDSTNAPALPTFQPEPPPAATAVETYLRSLIPSEARARKFRSHSFAARLTQKQREILFPMLQTESITDVEKFVAAPPPNGFGLVVHHHTLARLKRTIENTQLNYWLTNGFDAACDILEGPHATDVAPLREALRLLLYNRTMTYVRGEANPQSIDRLLSSITKLEKLTHMNSKPANLTHRIKLDVNLASIGHAVVTAPSHFHSVNVPELLPSAVPKPIGLTFQNCNLQSLPPEGQDAPTSS